MGLEDIVNFLLKPVEALAEIIYDVCFLIEVNKSVKKVDGKDIIIYSKKYSGSDIQKTFETMGKDYLTVKEFLMKYTFKLVDTVVSKTYDIIEEHLKVLNENLDKKVFTPLSEYVKKNPWKVATLVSLPFALYAGSLFYASGYPLYA